MKKTTKQEEEAIEMLVEWARSVEKHDDPYEHGKLSGAQQMALILLGAKRMKEIELEVAGRM